MYLAQSVVVFRGKDRNV